MRGTPKAAAATTSEPAKRMATFEIVREFRVTIHPDDGAAILRDSEGDEWLAFNCNSLAVLEKLVESIEGRLSLIADMHAESDESTPSMAFAADELLVAIAEDVEALSWPLRRRDDCPDVPPAKRLAKAEIEVAA